MEHELSGFERGWWVVSQEAKLWLPQGELPYGSAADAGLTGMPALPIGKWAGGSGLAGAPNDAAGHGIGAANA